MPSHTKSKIPQQAFDWYDEYAHGGMDRRAFLDKLGTLAIVGLTLGSITEALLPNYALAEQVLFTDPDIKATYREFPSPDGHGTGRGYLVRPTNVQGDVPAVLVVHENRGLNPYIKDVARRVAKAGFIAFAPDALFPIGGYPGNDDEGRTMQGSLDSEKIDQDFIAAAVFLKTLEGCNGNLGVVGFCFGGYVSNMLAASLPDVINASVPFYGSRPKDEIIGNIKAPMMMQFGELDSRITNDWLAYEPQLKSNNIDYQAFVYPGANHGFHNDSTARYDEEAAELAWSRTIDFFNEQLIL